MPQNQFNNNTTKQNFQSQIFFFEPSGIEKYEMDLSEHLKGQTDLKESAWISFFEPSGMDELKIPKRIRHIFDILKERQLKLISQQNISLASWNLYPSKDPFKISISQFLKMDSNNAIKLYIQVYDKYKGKLETAWEKGIRHTIICNDKIVFQSTDFEDIPNETVEEITKKYNKPCYVFSSPDLVEESPWTNIDPDDDYPTLCLYLDMHDKNEKEIVEKSPSIYPDFDTGNYNTKVFDPNLFEGSIVEHKIYDYGQSKHFDKIYHYFRKRVKLCAKDINDNIKSIICIVRFVFNWKSSPFMLASPKRVGFIGRDVIQKFQMKLELDPIKKMSRILEFY